MILGVIGKVGAFFVTIPYSVIGGLQVINFGVLAGVMLSNLQFIDLNSKRNLSIIGISMLIAMMLQHWIKSTKDAIETGRLSFWITLSDWLTAEYHLKRVFLWFVVGNQFETWFFIGLLQVNTYYPISLLQDTILKHVFLYVRNRIPIIKYFFIGLFPNSILKYVFIVFYRTPFYNYISYCFFCPKCFLECSLRDTSLIHVCIGW